MLRPYNGDARVCRRAMDEAIEQIAFEETDASGDGMTSGVAAGDGESRARNIGGVDRCSGQIFREGDGDAAGAGADIGDLQAFAGEGLFAAGAPFADSEAIEGNFDDVLGFGAGNQDVGCYFKLEAPEFLFAGEVLRRFAMRAPRNKCEKARGVGSRDFIFGTGGEPTAVAAYYMKKQEFRGKCERGDVRVAQLCDAIL